MKLYVHILDLDALINSPHLQLDCLFKCDSSELCFYQTNSAIFLSYATKIQHE